MRLSLSWLTILLTAGLVSAQTLAVTGTPATAVPVTSGGTGAATAAGAVTNLNTMTDAGANGMVARTAANTTAARTLQPTTNSALTWTNGDGVSGNPTPAFVFPSKIVYDTAVCQGTTAIGLLSLPASNTPAASCVTGSNTNYGVLTFSATGQSIQDHMKLPGDWTGAIDVDFVYRSVGTTGNVVWSIQTACNADGATGDPTFNTAQTVSTAAQGTTLQWKTASITGITMTGCSANNEFHFKPSLHSSTTTTGLIDLIAVRFTVRRSL
jgi:hypothetical protein